MGLFYEDTEQLGVANHHVCGAARCRAGELHHPTAVEDSMGPPVYHNAFGTARVGMHGCTGQLYRNWPVVNWVAHEAVEAQFFAAQGSGCETYYPEHSPLRRLSLRQWCEPLVHAGEPWAALAEDFPAEDFVLHRRCAA